MESTESTIPETLSKINETPKKTLCQFDKIDENDDSDEFEIDEFDDIIAQDFDRHPYHYM